ncbi:MAG: hypothetical protein LW808_000435 [Verrucomicrobiota bacterium]|nr:MAG: hypothetical protein LW808_000435 [Verrucomicrobiota bacterium]
MDPQLCRKIPHAIIVESENFIQAQQYVQQYAQTLLETDYLETCPDYHVLSPEGKAHKIKIEAIRALIEEVQKSPQGSIGKVFVINQAEALNKNAADALLKTLEEPPPDTHFFLITDAKNRLLPTVISRCVLHHLPKAPVIWPSDIEAWIQDCQHFLEQIFLKNNAPNVFEIYRLLHSLMAAFKNLDTEGDTESVSVLQERLLREIGRNIGNALLGHFPAIRVQSLIDTLQKAQTLLGLNATFAQAMEFILLEFASFSQSPVA